MSHGRNFSRRLLISTDAKAYGSGDDQRHRSIQTGLLSVLDEAAALAGLSRSSWDKQGAGDGELAVLPLTEDEPRVVDGFIHHLQGTLTRHNHDLRPEAHLRLRMAIHYGLVAAADNGFAGQGVVAVSRLVECAPLHAALDTTDACLAVILSAQVFRDTIVQRHTSLSIAEFRKVSVHIKEFRDDAWLRVPNRDVHSLDLSDEPARPMDESSDSASTPSIPQRSEPRGTGMHAEFYDKVDVNGVLGVVYR